MQTDPISVLLVDDHYIVRAGIRDLLIQGAGANLSEPLTLSEDGVGEAGSGQEALKAIQEKSYSMVLLDFNLPDMNGLELLRRIKALKPGLPVLMFSSYAESEYAMACFREGAAGYLSKDALPEEIRRAIRTAASGQDFISPTLKQQLFSSVRPQSCEPHERLTSREYEVFIGISRGVPLGEIAESLKISVKTVSTHRAKLLEKMGMKSNAEVARYVEKRRLDKQSASF